MLCERRAAEDLPNVLAPPALFGNLRDAVSLCAPTTSH